MIAYKSSRYRKSVPQGGYRSTLAGGNTVGGALREKAPRDDGYRHIDTPALIALLTYVGANHYTFSIWDSPTDWDDLRLEFAPAARDAGIQVMPYIVPPTETSQTGRSSKPYEMDYVAWGTAIAELSLQYTNVTAWAIDDFDIGDNGAVFTDEYLAKVREAQLRINPALGFFTCAYHPTATTQAFYERYGRFIDGLIYPYLDGPNTNTLDASSSPEEIDEIVALAKSFDVEVLWLVYTGRFLDAPSSPTDGYVSEAVGHGVAAGLRGKTLGTIAYGMQVDGAPTISNELRAMYGNGRGALSVGRSRVTEGSSADLSTAITVDPDSPRYELSFWHSRTFQGDMAPARGDFVLHVLIDGALVWSGDVLDSIWLGLYVQGEVLDGPFRIDSAVHGKSTATLTFRLTALRETWGVHFDVGIDNLESVGVAIQDPGFEEPSAWVANHRGIGVRAVVDLFVPDRPARILAAVRRAYSNPSSPDRMPATPESPQ